MYEAYCLWSSAIYCAVLPNTRRLKSATPKKGKHRLLYRFTSRNDNYGAWGINLWNKKQADSVLQKTESECAFGNSLPKAYLLSFSAEYCLFFIWLRLW